MELDDEIRHELMDSFNDLAEQLEYDLNRLEHEPENKDILASVFRAIHSMKGNAGIVQLMDIVAFAHSIEEVAESLRSRHYPANSAICEAFRLGIDRLRDLHNRDIFNHQISHLREQEIAELFCVLATSPPEKTEEAANNILRLMSNGVPLDSKSPVEDNQTTQSASQIESANNNLHEDLSFFQTLSFQIDSQSNYWQGRSIQSFHWAMKMNKIGGNVVDYDQFAAAIYLHDIGMSFLPNSLLSAPGKLDEEQIAQLHSHPLWGYNYLVRIPGWKEAADIILDHHERIDGTGYPNKKLGADIHPGAKILAIIDAFFSMLRGRADRSQRASVLRAISEINSKADTQFDGMWLQCFNHMIREELKDGQL